MKRFQQNAVNTFQRSQQYFCHLSNQMPKIIRTLIPQEVKPPQEKNTEITEVTEDVRANQSPDVEPETAKELKGSQEVNITGSQPSTQDKPLEPER